MIGLSEYIKKQIVFAFMNEGEKISFKNDNLVVKDKDGKTKWQSTCWQIGVLFIVGRLTITSGLIERSHKFCFPIFLMRPNLRTYDVIGFKAEGNTFLRSLQYSCDGLDIAKHLVQNKIVNQRSTLLKQRHRSDEANNVVAKLKRYAKNVSNAASIQELMGIEGSASRIYFPQHFNNCTWQGRKPRSKQDYINTTLDIGYTILFNYIESLLYFFGFDVYVGNLHQQFYMRKSLVCDLVEPFRPLMDICIRKAISLGQCKESDFTTRNKKVTLDWAHNKEYLLFLLQPINENKEAMFKYIRDYYRAFSQKKSTNNFPVFKV